MICPTRYAFEAMDESLCNPLINAIANSASWISRLGATYLGEVPQAVNAIALTLISLCWQLPLAISQSIAIRVGNLLGARQHKKAKCAAKAAQIFTLIIAGVTAIFLQVMRRSFGHLFSKDPLVVEVFDRMVSPVLL